MASNSTSNATGCSVTTRREDVRSIGPTMSSLGGCWRLISQFFFFFFFSGGGLLQTLGVFVVVFFSVWGEGGSFCFEAIGGLVCFGVAWWWVVLDVAGIWFVLFGFLSWSQWLSLYFGVCVFLVFNDFALTTYFKNLTTYFKILTTYSEHHATFQGNLATYFLKWVVAMS